MRLATLIIAAAILPVALAQNPALERDNPNTYAQADTARIVQEVRKRLLSLADYSVFDSLSLGIRGRAIILNGFASRPTPRDDAQRSVKSIPGVEAVKN